MNVTFILNQHHETHRLDAVPNKGDLVWLVNNEREYEVREVRWILRTDEVQVILGGLTVNV